MKHTKFLVQVSRVGASSAQYVQRIDRKPIQTTLVRNLALLMGRVTAMEVLESFDKSRWTPQIVAVHVNGPRTPSLARTGSLADSEARSS